MRIHPRPWDTTRTVTTRTVPPRRRVAFESPALADVAALAVQRRARTGHGGSVFRNLLGEPILFAAALATGVLFERFSLRHVESDFRFESTPASTLESSVMDEATAVTAFDRNGQGLIAVEVDGQMVQVLGTLSPATER